MSSSQNINSKDCSYGCSTRIYWNTSENAYFEVFSKKKHVCQNRSVTTAAGYKSRQTTTTNIVASNKPIYRNNYKKSYFATQKPKMSNSLELSWTNLYIIIFKKSLYSYYFIPKC